VNDRDITKATLKEKALAAAILMDKAVFLERGHRPLSSSIPEGHRPLSPGVIDPSPRVADPGIQTKQVTDPGQEKEPPPEPDEKSDENAISYPAGTETLKHPPALVTG
jgi:hypothetical protein